MENFIFCAVSVKELYNIYTRETCYERLTLINPMKLVKLFEFQGFLPEEFHFRLSSGVIAMVTGERTKKKMK